MEKNAIQTVILAAGRGIRMQSKKPKVLFRVGGKPILQRSIELSKTILSTPPIVVIPAGSHSVEKLCIRLKTVICIDPFHNGTANGLKASLPFILPQTRYLLVYNSDDSYLYSADTINRLISYHLENNFCATMLVVRPEHSYPNIRKIHVGENNRFLGLLPPENPTNILCCGCYIFNRSWVEKMLPQVTPNPKNQEYQITSLFELGLTAKDKIGVSFLSTPRQWWGINTKSDLVTARKLWKKMNP